MPPPKIFQAFKRSTSRGGSAAPTHGMEPRPYEYGSVGRNSHYRPDTMYTDATVPQEQGHSAYSGRTAIDDDEDYEDLGEYSNARHHAIPVELSDTSESRIPRVQRMDDPRSTMYDTIPEEDEETARTVSDDYVDIGHHPHGDYYHRSRSSHYTDDTMMQDYGPHYRHHSPYHQPPAMHTPSRHGSQRYPSEPTMLDYRSHTTSYIPPPGQVHVPSYAPQTAAQPPLTSSRADYRDYGAASSSHRQAKYQETTAKVNFAPQERHRDRYDRRDNREQTLPRREYTQPAVHTISHSGSRRRGETYYIIPGNKPVIFKDQRGNEIARVGDFSGKTRSRRRHPIIVQDEYGHELYRSGDVDDPYGRSRDHGNHRREDRPDGSDHSSRTSESSPRAQHPDRPRYDNPNPEIYDLPIKLVDQWGRPLSPRVETVSRHGSMSSRSRDGRAPRPPPNVILIDDFGNQIPIKVPSSGSAGGPYHPTDHMLHDHEVQMQAGHGVHMQPFHEEHAQGPW